MKLGLIPVAMVVISCAGPTKQHFLIPVLVQAPLLEANSTDPLPMVQCRVDPDKYSYVGLTRDPCRVE